MQLLVSYHGYSDSVLSYVHTCSSLEYAPHFYGLFLHNNEMLPHTSSMWEYLDQQFPSGYQDTVVLHMMYSRFLYEHVVILFDVAVCIRCL